MGKGLGSGDGEGRVVSGTVLQCERLRKWVCDMCMDSKLLCTKDLMYDMAQCEEEKFLKVMEGVECVCCFIFRME